MSRNFEMWALRLDKELSFTSTRSNLPGPVKVYDSKGFLVRIVSREEILGIPEKDMVKSDCRECGRSYLKEKKNETTLCPYCYINLVNVLRERMELNYGISI